MTTTIDRKAADSDNALTRLHVYGSAERGSRFDLTVSREYARTWRGRDGATYLGGEVSYVVRWNGDRGNGWGKAHRLTFGGAAADRDALEFAEGKIAVLTAWLDAVVVVDRRDGAAAVWSRDVAKMVR